MLNSRKEKLLKALKDVITKLKKQQLGNGTDFTILY